MAGYSQLLTPKHVNGGRSLIRNPETRPVAACSIMSIDYVQLDEQSSDNLIKNLKIIASCEFAVLDAEGWEFAYC